MEEVAVEQAEQTPCELVGEGYTLIFATAPEYSDAVLTVANEFPETRFEVCRGDTTAGNVVTYDGRIYQIFYLLGGILGEMTVTGKIGFIAPEPNVEVIRDINALTIAGRIIRYEDITVHVRWTGSWNYLEADLQAARADRGGRRCADPVHLQPRGAEGG